MPTAGPPPPPLRPLILEAKLHPPVGHREHVARPRLHHVLDAGADRKLTLVDAPAGFGKSTLLAAWCAQLPTRRCAWLSLDEDDNDPVVFWTYVLHALGRVTTADFDAGLALLQRPGASLTRRVLPQVLNDLWSLADPIALILDDYHEISSLACHEALDFFLRRLPSTVHLVIATRSDPPLRLAALRARGELAEIRAAQLRFTDDEIATLLNDLLGLGLTDAALGQLADRTEGWAAGLYLAALSLQGQDDVPGFIADFSGQHRHLVDYLGAEVLDRLPAATRSFLLHTSVLDTLTAPLCDVVTGRADGAAQLAELERTNQFLIPLDEGRTSYRYHHLFQELLRVELARTAPDLMPELHRRAAGCFTAMGDAAGAMRHALAAQDHAAAAAIFIENGQRFSVTGRFSTLVGWMDQLPAAVIVAQPPLALAVAWVAAQVYRPKAEVEHWLTVAATCDLPGPFVMGSHTMPSGVALVRATYVLDDVGAALRAAESAAAVEVDPKRLTYLIALKSLGQALYFAGRPAEARPLLEAAIRAPLAGQQGSAVTRAMAMLSMANLDLGEIARAEEWARRSVELSDRLGMTDHPTHWTPYLALAMVLGRQGRFAEAEAVLATGVEPRLPGLTDWCFPRALILLGLAPVRFARGHAEAAHALLAEARAAIAACPDPGMLPARLEATERALHRLPRRKTGLRQDLSEGELRVLRLLASDLSRREISRELYLSVNTIKTHTRNIFTKLDATSRSDAVGRARTLGLIA